MLLFIYLPNTTTTDPNTNNNTRLRYKLQERKEGWTGRQVGRQLAIACIRTEMYLNTHLLLSLYLPFSRSNGGGGGGGRGGGKGGRGGGGGGYYTVILSPFLPSPPNKVREEECMSPHLNPIATSSPPTRFTPLTMVGCKMCKLRCYDAPGCGRKRRRRRESTSFFLPYPRGERRKWRRKEKRKNERREWSGVESSGGR